MPSSTGLSKPPAGRAPRRRRRGAVALEYILIAAIVAIGLIISFRLWGRVTAAAVERSAVDTRGALIPEP
jgi:Flp pilus assembly protein TadG